jgi:hypothetical protein
MTTVIARRCLEHYTELNAMGAVSNGGPTYGKPTGPWVSPELMGGLL